LFLCKAAIQILCPNHIVQSFHTQQKDTAIFILLAAPSANRDQLEIT
jgi:hypothetical protein